MIPLQAEAEAIVWVAQIAEDLGVDRVCIKSDSKSCIDSLNCYQMKAHWCISSLIL